MFTNISRYFSFNIFPLELYAEKITLFIKKIPSVYIICLILYILVCFYIFFIISFLKNTKKIIKNGQSRNNSEIKKNLKIRKNTTKIPQKWLCLK